MSIYKGTQLISGVATPLEAGRNIGQIIQSLLPITDAGLHLLDGTLIDGNGIYKAFVDYIKTLDLTASYFCTENEWQASVEQYGVCGKFVYDATANTVRLPKVTGLVEGTIDANALGDLVEAGLPNITGEFASTCQLTGDDNPSTSGAIGSKTGSTTKYVNFTSNTANRAAGFTFNAANSNSIYGNSTTVQPQTIKGYYYIVIATVTKTDIEVDIDNIVTDLNDKVNISNMVDAGPYIASCAMPSDKYVDLTLGASGATYTAPADGYIYFMCKLKNVGARYFVNCKGKTEATIYGVLVTQAGTAALSSTLPVKKGDTFFIGYDAYDTSAEVPYIFRFIYAVGSESEA